jgi:imidazolonepropionase-like amidohydrolase
MSPVKSADLVLLEAYPLAEITNTKRIVAVVLGGRLLSKAKLDRRIKTLANQFSADAHR